MRLKTVSRILVTKNELENVSSVGELLGLISVRTKTSIDNLSGCWITRDCVDMIGRFCDFKNGPRVDAFMQPRADGRFVIDVEINN